MELTVEHCNVDLEKGTVIITGYDLSEIVREAGAKKLLAEMEYSDITEYVAEEEENKREIAEMSREDR